ncbi:patatin-like phospholipase family protein [Lentibacillus sediminis]|uniref:patatin-like phospholipase family protein n=1 Tax=Lentibacillus sediminis TaxID=1940529 RepID=UPI000C1B8D8B|nr:patatin-like phospholipase family protein [Lentibacillus sediminis]
MKIDGVFSGGGVKAYAFIGVLESLEQKGLKLERAAGTSAGAIMASFVAADYHAEEVKALFYDLELKRFLDPPKITQWLPFSRWLFLYFQLGLYKGDRLEKWLQVQLGKKGVHTFADLKTGYLKVVVSDLSLGKLVVIPDDLERIYQINPREFSVAKAVRMSAGFPYFFMPGKIMGANGYKSIIVDGGLLSNFPLWLFARKNAKDDRPVLGIKLTENMEEERRPQSISNAFDLFHALFSTMKQAHDTRYISTTDQPHIMFVPVEKTETMDFQLNEERRVELIQSGRETADRFLKHWPK